MKVSLGKLSLLKYLAFAAVILVLTVTPGKSAKAAALFVPDNIISENRNGRQLIIKTYTLMPEDDPAPLVEESFEQEGFLYTFINIVKEELPFESRKAHSETITVETAGDDLSAILEALTPTLSYEDGSYSGTLMLDHTSLHTAASGYSTKSYTISETKTIGSLDRNDPSYIPKTTLKNGRTLNLSNIEWSVQATALADDALVPTQFMATATYKSSASQKVANSYITTATYSGEIVSAGIANIIYTVTYYGEPLAENIDVVEKLPLWPYMVGFAILLLLVAAVLSLLLQKNVKIYAFAENGLEYELLSREKLNQRNPIIDLCDLGQYPAPEAIIELKRRSARRLFGRAIRIRLRHGTVRTHLVEHTGSGNYWFSISTQEDEIE